MIKQCKHCGTLYKLSQGSYDFCCAGCEQVHALIEAGGLGDYYNKQDRAGRPVGDQPRAKIDFVLIDQLQRQAETAAECKINLSIRGMSCMACAWLIEQLAKRQSSVTFAAVALDSNQLSLVWKRGTFKLSELAEELQKYGYSISGVADATAFKASPLAVRLGLTLVFSANGLLLEAASLLGVGGADLQLLYKLLIAACLIFSLQIGGSLFIRPFWRGLLLRRLHRDALPALLLLILFTLAIVSVLFPGGRSFLALLYFLLLPLLVLARWLSERRVLRKADV